MAENIVEQQLGGAMEFRRSEGLSPEVSRVARAIKELSELRAPVNTVTELNQTEKSLFGDRDKLWDEKSMMASEFNKTLKTDTTLNQDQKNRVTQGVATLSESLQGEDLTKAANQLQIMKQRLEQATGSERRTLELLAGATELVVAKWRFGKDRELVERITVLGRDGDIGTIEASLKLVSEATTETRKRDEAGHRADVEGDKRHTREIWYTEKWQSINGHTYARETSSTKFIREEIKGEGGVETKANHLDERYKFGDGMEEMVNWRFFKREKLNDAIDHNGVPGFLKDSLETIKRMAGMIDPKLKEAKYLPRMDEMRQLTVGQAVVRGVWRTLQDNVRAGLTLLENDVTGDMLSCRPDQSLTPKIVENKAKGIFEYAVNPEERKSQEKEFYKLKTQVEYSLQAIEKRQKELQDTGVMTRGAVTIKDESRRKRSFEISLRSETFDQMFLVENNRTNLGSLEYQAWIARSRLQLLTHTSLDIHEPLHKLGVQGPSLWAYLEGMVALSGKSWVPDILKTDAINRFPDQAEFWLLQFWLNKGKDVVIDDIKGLPYYKRTAAERFKEVAVKAYYAPAKGKRTEAGVWLDHSQPISPTIYKKRIKNLQEGKMIWDETGRPTMVNLWYYGLYATWEATTHFTEYGQEEYKIWLQSHGQNTENPVAYIQGFPAFFSEKLAAGLALPLLPDLVYSSQGMLSELYPLIQKANGEYEIVEFGERLEQIPEAELFRTFREEMKKARQQYIFSLLPVLESEIFDQIRYLLAGEKVTSTKMGRKALSSHPELNVFALWERNIFAQHATETWCGVIDEGREINKPNEYYKRIIKTVRGGKEIAKPKSTPIDINFVSVFQRTETINEQQGAALILSGVPDEVIDEHLPMVLFGRREYDPERSMLNQALNFAELVWGKKTDKNPHPHSKILEMIAAGATPKDIGKAFGARSEPAEKLAELIQYQLYYRFAGVISPGFLYDVMLFSWAREVTHYFDPLSGENKLVKKIRTTMGKWGLGPIFSLIRISVNNPWSPKDYKFVKDPYLADIDVWEEVATWRFKTGPREGQRIFYHPSIDPAEEAYDAYFHRGLQASGLTKYEKKEEREEVWPGGDLILTLAADSLIRLKGLRGARQAQKYTEVNRFAPSIPIDLSHDKFALGQVHDKLKALNFYRPGVDYGLVPKPRELYAILESNFFQLNRDQVNQTDSILNGAWPWLRREFTYLALDFIVGQPDGIQKALEGFKKEGGVLGAGGLGPLFSFLFNSAFTPFPQFRATPLAVWPAIGVGLAVAGSGVFFGAVGGAIAGLYVFNWSGRIIQGLFGGGWEAGLNYLKKQGGFLIPMFRFIPDGVKRASKRILAPFSALAEIGNKPTVFWHAMQEKDLAARREGVAKLANGIAQDELTSN